MWRAPSAASDPYDATTPAAAAARRQSLTDGLKLKKRQTKAQMYGSSRSSESDAPGFKNFQDAMRNLGGEAKLFAGGADSPVNQETAKNEFQTSVFKTRENLKSRTRGLLKPHGKFLQCWDLVTASGLIFTLFVTPFEVGMDLPTTVDGPLVGLFAVNQLVTAIFAADIAVNFFTPTPRNDRGDFERRHSVLAANYLTSWFVLDTATIVPFDILSMPQVGVVSPAAKGMKLLRVARLFKLIKVLKASSIIQRWQHQVAFSSSSMKVFAWTFLATVLLHWLACFWALMPRLQPDQLAGYGLTAEQLQAAAAPTCTGCFAGSPANEAHCGSGCLAPCEQEALALLTGEPLPFIANSDNWLCRAVRNGLITQSALETGGAAGSVYFTSLLVSMLQLVGGVSTVLPMNAAEYIFFFVAIAVGAVLFAAVQGIICGVVTNGNPDETRWHQNLDALNFMMADTMMPKEERVKVRQFFQKSKQLFKRRSYGDLIDGCLSKEMQGDVRYLISHEVFNGVWWLRHLDRQYLEDLSVRLQRQAFAPKEQIEMDDMLNVLTVGMATRGGTFMMPGMWFGDVFLTSPALRDTRPATCLIYCEVARLARHDIFEVAERFPKEAAKLKQTGLQTALERTITLVALQTKANGEDGKASAMDALQSSFAMAFGGRQQWRNIVEEDDGSRRVVPGDEDVIHTKAEVVDELKRAPKTMHTELLARQIVDTRESVASLSERVDAIHAIVATQFKEVAAATARAKSPASLPAPANLGRFEA